mmetsp:Transcript_6790/g.25332  ORF Transcript_6790/g.25332 Transcript_6790/m.25332 type:complete len:141 (-) Transcript_6790:949-1371(-)
MKCINQSKKKDTRIQKWIEGSEKLEDHLISCFIPADAKNAFDLILVTEEEKKEVNERKYREVDPFQRHHSNDLQSQTPHTQSACVCQTRWRDFPCKNFGDEAYNQLCKSTLVEKRARSNWETLLFLANLLGTQFPRKNCA